MITPDVVSAGRPSLSAVTCMQKSFAPAKDFQKQPTDGWPTPVTMGAMASIASQRLRPYVGFGV